MFQAWLNNAFRSLGHRLADNTGYQSVYFSWNLTWVDIMMRSDIFNIASQLPGDFE